MNYTIAMRSAFSRSTPDGDSIGGNPAGILISEQLPTAELMQLIAHKVGASETVFAAPLDDSNSRWKVRFYSPEQEIPFCGHATLALITELFEQFTLSQFTFALSEQTITVAFEHNNAVITTPKPRFEYVDNNTHHQVLDIFDLSQDALCSGDESDSDNHPNIVLVNAGSNHLAIELNSRDTLANMRYDFDAARVFMQQRKIATIALLYRQSPYEIYIRHAFAFGGVYEDPATGSGAAAVAGFLYATKSEYQENDKITFLQGDDMGQPCTLITQLPASPSDSLKLIGESRQLNSKTITVSDALG